MEINKLLQRQLQKYFNGKLPGDGNMNDFIQAVNDSYSTFEKDKELSNHAFMVSERDYKEIYTKLNTEINLRNISIEKLKNAIKNIQDDEQILFTDKEDDLLAIVAYLDQQITKRKEIEKELVAAKETAEASTQSKELFLANMSHEIRTPINAIFGMANQLAKTTLTEKQHFYLNIIHTAADNLLIIINDILDLSKVESGKLSLEKIGFEPKAVVGRVMQVMMHKAEEKGLNFINSFCDAKLFPVLLGDPYRLNQVILNLVSNAIKFTHKGTVDITCRVIKDSKENQTVKVSVSDTGIGMDEAFSKNLFQKFSQEDNSFIRKYGGTGLGMSICKHLVELMDGSIEVESKKGQGTTISFIINFQKGTIKDLPRKTKTEVDTAIISGKKILVTDDNEMNQLVAATILQNFGAEITEAFNGIEAIEKIKNNSYDLVLMDVQMPEMDGFEATGKIRETISKELPIIALTAFAIKGDNQKCLDAGMNDYLSKPFEESELLSVVSKWLQHPVSLPANGKVKNKEIALYNLSKLEEIAKGNVTFINKMITMFIEQTPAAVEEIQYAYANKNFEAVKKIAHRIKPSIDNMGITSLKTEIREIEKLAETNSELPQLELQIKKLHEVISKVVNELKLVKTL